MTSNPESRPAERANNVVQLRGRLAAAATEKELPSGDTLLAFRLTVDRPPAERGRVDSLDCVTTRSKVRRTLARARPGDELEVEGRLQRRFWRGPGGAQSRYAVDIRTARISRRSDATAAGRPGDA